MLTYFWGVPFVFIADFCFLEFLVDQTKRIEESIQIRREAEPVELVKAVSS